MKKYFAIAALAIVAAGCGQNAPADDPSAATKGPDKQATSDGLKPVEAVKGQEQVVTDPSQIKAGGSYRIEPADPNDEKYKADPRLAGGG
jgi:predicted small lipoprotein YifL